MPTIFFTKTVILLQYLSIFCPSRSSVRWKLVIGLIAANAVFFAILMFIEIFQVYLSRSGQYFINRFSVSHARRSGIQPSSAVRASISSRLSSLPRSSMSLTISLYLYYPWRGSGNCNLAPGRSWGFASSSAPGSCKKRPLRRLVKGRAVS